jgi:hypothetical protein
MMPAIITLIFYICYLFTLGPPLERVPWGNVLGGRPPPVPGVTLQAIRAWSYNILLNINVCLCPHIYSGEGLLSHRPRRVRADP